MPIGKSRRIVIDVEDIALKRNLYAALASEGRSLKDWFSAAVIEYLSIHSPRRPARVAELSAQYRASTSRKRRA